MNFGTKWHICSENAIFVYVYIIFRQILNMIGIKLAAEKKKTNGIAPASLAFRMYAARFEKDKK